MLRVRLITHLRRKCLFKDVFDDLTLQEKSSNDEIGELQIDIDKALSLQQLTETSTTNALYSLIQLDRSIDKTNIEHQHVVNNLHSDQQHTTKHSAMPATWIDYSIVVKIDEESNMLSIIEKRSDILHHRSELALSDFVSIISAQNFGTRATK